MSSCCGALADERLDLAQDRARAALRTAGRRAPRRCVAETAFAEQLVVGVHRLADAVGEQQEDVARLERHRHLLEQPLETLAVVELQAEHHAAGREHAGAADGVACRQVDDRRVAGPRVGHRARLEIDDRVGHRDEAAAVEICRDDPVGRDEQLARRPMDLRQRQHQPLQLGHVERRRRALARHVGDQQADALVVERQEVVVVAADLARRANRAPSWTGRAFAAGPAAAATSGCRGRCAAPPRAASSRPSRQQLPRCRPVIVLNESASSPS